MKQFSQKGMKYLLLSLTVVVSFSAVFSLVSAQQYLVTHIYDNGMGTQIEITIDTNSITTNKQWNEVVVNLKLLAMPGYAINICNISLDYQLGLNYADQSIIAQNFTAVSQTLSTVITFQYYPDWGSQDLELRLQFSIYRFEDPNYIFVNYESEWFHLFALTPDTQTFVEKYRQEIIIAGGSVGSLGVGFGIGRLGRKRLPLRKVPKESKALFDRFAEQAVSGNETETIEAWKAYRKSVCNNMLNEDLGRLSKKLVKKSDPRNLSPLELENKNQRNQKITQTISNILKKKSSTEDGVIRNLK